MSDEQRAFGAWRRHLGEVIGVADGDVVADEVAARSWIRDEFRQQDERVRGMIHRELSQATWRWMGLMVAQTGVFVALVPLLT